MDNMQLRFENREELEEYQLHRLNQLLAEVLPENRFYQAKFKTKRLEIASLEEWKCFPFTTKDELSCGADGNGVAPHHTYGFEQYTRFHRTSGSTGHPLIVMDRPSDWDWWMSCWDCVLNAASISSRDVIFMAFSFGPFIGFWTAHDACLRRMCRIVPGGGLSSAARLELIRMSKANVLFCTPTYAMHLVSEAKLRGIDIQQLGISKIIVAGEAGGSDPEVQQRIENAFHAKVFDHAGATEVGAWGYASSDRTGLHVNEKEFIAEFIPSECKVRHACGEEQVYELVLTTLGRAGVPVFRYRTGDLVCREVDAANENSPAPWLPTFSYVKLKRGVIARADQMMTIRGVNVFPSSIEAILRDFPLVEEFRMTATRQSEMDQLKIEVEDAAHSPELIADAIDLRLGLRVTVQDVPPGTLGRSQEKSKRFVDLR